MEHILNNIGMREAIVEPDNKVSTVFRTASPHAKTIEMGSYVKVGAAQAYLYRRVLTNEMLDGKSFCVKNELVSAPEVDLKVNWVDYFLLGRTVSRKDGTRGKIVAVSSRKDNPWVVVSVTSSLYVLTPAQMSGWFTRFKPLIEVYLAPPRGVKNLKPGMLLQKEGLYYLFEKLYGTSMLVFSLSGNKTVEVEKAHVDQFKLVGSRKSISSRITSLQSRAGAETAATTSPFSLMLKGFTATLPESTHILNDFAQKGEHVRKSLHLLPALDKVDAEALYNKHAYDAFSAYREVLLNSYSTRAKRLAEEKLLSHVHLMLEKTERYLEQIEQVAGSRQDEISTFLEDKLRESALTLRGAPLA